MCKQATNVWTDLRYLTLFPKDYGVPQGKSAEYWRKVSRDYGNRYKRVCACDYKWYVITFKDGRRELAYITPNQKYHVLRRGIIPRRWRLTQFAHVKDMRLAF